ncbi:metal-dependent hydrolase [Actinomadura darangshiensis]|uniref:Metal-dependent hydrolase n=1 Tax=Actinomadura darangshiensis TaxID=705336 RepID=A0A4R4ZZR4_9ACTN|nr:metal-dependent hydrolase [Actinomadura darangshiensis]TDD64871.1 metal-dependent hydrolase [Actinomadura darangshiensis]
MTQRTIRTRRIAFDHPKGSLRRHYVDGDLVMSHIVALLSATFPPGEDFFVRSVRHYSDRIKDPDLAEQVRGFIGQEVVHGREHDNLNRTLRKMGYPTHRISALVERDLRLADRLLPPIVRLGYTAALEHYTATIAECLLTDPRAQALLGDTSVRSILLWHALEESEHKAVAFDVYRHVGGGERTRIRTMRLISTGFLFLVVTGTFISLLADPATYLPGRLRRSLAALRHSPFLSREVIRRLRAYNKRGFHPDDFDSTALLDHWREELFGAEGTLNANLR